MEKLQALIFNIQRYSIHDGPGIRTNVFFKGCPLKCKWCANPESQSPTRQILYNYKDCAKCRTCLKVCPKNAISLIDDRIIIDRDICDMCMKCVESCPTHALYTEGQYYTIESLLKEVLKDEAFYRKSGGGVTLSGGEAMMQKEFVVEFLRRLKDLDIHTNIETAGFIDSNSFREIIKSLDLIYFDVKHYDSKKHKQMTGVPNELILKNLKIAVEENKDIVVRIPIIPRFNHSVSDAHQFATLLKSIGINQVHLLPFHQFGENKWDILGQYYEYRGEPNMRDEQVEKMCEVFSNEGFKVQIGG